MPPRLKRAPPYEDNPECKYIVINDPWPGNKVGKERDDVYWNFLCAWVRFMLNKKHEPECVFAVNTRNEVIVQLPEEADVVPILGAHPWIEVLSHGDPRDRDRVSHVFAYDYRMKGEPGNHNWLAHYPTEIGDPPKRIRFPVKFPYPHVSWASPRGKSCANISLPLPPVRQPTPIPDTSGFTPYQHPPQLTSSTISNAEALRQEQEHKHGHEAQQFTGSGEPGKIDPYTEERNALRNLKQEDADVKPHVKHEDGAYVKVKPEPYGPSKSFRSAIEQLQQSRENEDGRSTTVSSDPLGPGGVKPEDEPPKGPSDAFIAAFHTLRGTEGHEQSAPASEPKVKSKMEENPYYPSNAFVAAIQGLRCPPSTTGDDQPERAPLAELPVKPDPETKRSSVYSTPQENFRIKREPEDGRQRTSGTTLTDEATPPVKRVKEEPHDGRYGKRIRY